MGRQTIRRWGSRAALALLVPGLLAPVETVEEYGFQTDTPRAVRLAPVWPGPQARVDELRPEWLERVTAELASRPTPGPATMGLTVRRHYLYGLFRNVQVADAWYFQSYCPGPVGLSGSSVES